MERSIFRRQSLALSEIPRLVDSSLMIVTTESVKLAKNKMSIILNDYANIALCIKNELVFQVLLTSLSKSI